MSVNVAHQNPYYLQIFKHAYLRHCHSILIQNVAWEFETLSQHTHKNVAWDFTTARPLLHYLHGCAANTTRVTKCTQHQRLSTHIEKPYVQHKTRSGPECLYTELRSRFRMHPGVRLPQKPGLRLCPESGRRT